MDERTRRILKIASGDLPLVPSPFDEWAQTAGMPREEFTLVLVQARERGVIRRFGAVLAHTKTGMKKNAMVAWDVPIEDADRAGEIMAGFDQVSHCYLRETAPGWPYRLYTMIHAPDDRTLYAVINAIKEKTGIAGNIVLPSVREFKKTSPDYLEED